MILKRDADPYTIVEWRRHGRHRLVVRQKQSLALMAYGGYTGSGVDLTVLVEPEEMHPKRVEAVHEAAMWLQDAAFERLVAEGIR